MDLRGKTVVITGGARIGKTVAHSLAGKGANIVLSYRKSRGPAEETATEVRGMGCDCLVVKADASKEGDVKRLVQAAVKNFGSLDVLVNMASVFYPTPIEKLTEKELDDNYAANVKTMVLCSKYAAQVMQKQKNGGTIVNFSDSDVYRPYSQYLAYFATKGAVPAITMALAKELAPKVRVNAVALGAILLPPGTSDAVKRKIIESTPLKRLGTPEEVAMAVVFLAENDYVTGSTVFVDGGSFLG